MPLRATQQPGRELRATVAAAGRDDSDAVNRAALQAGDLEGGNACLGIAVGCVLSLPIWLGLAAVSYMLR